MTTPLSILLLLITGCSAVSSTLKKGDEAVARGQYYVAAAIYLEALEKSPKHRESLDKLSAVSKTAYDQKLETAAQYEQSDNLEQAVREYQELREYIGKLRRFGVLSFVPINIDAKITEASQGAAEKHYKRAEDFFNQGSYLPAITAYENALKLRRSYKDATRKIAESNYRLASSQAERGQYRNAALAFKRALDSVSGYRDAAEKSARLYFSLGEYFLSGQHCRKAYEDFSAARSVYSSLPELSMRIGEAEECATTKIAFASFENLTGRNLAGMNIGDVISESIQQETLSRASQFIRMFDRDQLGLILREQNIGFSALSSESSVPQTLEGVDYLIFGKLNQVRQTHDGLSKTPASSTYTYAVSVPYRDKDGKRKTRTERRSGTAYFSEFDDQMAVNLSGTIRVVDVKTGAVVINYQIAETDGDQIKYLDEARAQHNLNQVQLPDHVVSLLRARRELEDIDTVVRRMIDRISTTMAGEILGGLDRTPSASDPTHLEVASSDLN